MRTPSLEFKNQLCHVLQGPKRRGDNAKNGLETRARDIILMDFHEIFTFLIILGLKIRNRFKKRCYFEGVSIQVRNILEFTLLFTLPDKMSPPVLLHRLTDSD